MAVERQDKQKVARIVESQPNVTIFLRPIAPPAALGLAGYAGSTWITASWIAAWWGGTNSPTIFFPFVAFWGGLAQFIAGLYGYAARDTLVTVMNTMWGAFYMSIGLLYLLVGAGAVKEHSIYDHSAELASWFIVLAFVTWSGAIASLARDMITAATYFTLAVGSTIACSLFAAGGGGVHNGIKAAAYFMIFSSILAYYRVTAFLLEEAFGPDSKMTKLVPIYRLPVGIKQPLMQPGLDEPGVRRGMRGVI